MSQIRWNLVVPGDVIEIDAGAVPNTPVVYRTPLVVQKSGNDSDLIWIQVSNQAGHNQGYANISVPTTSPAAINLQNNRQISISAAKWRNLRTVGGKVGLLIGQNTDGVTLHNLEVQGALHYGVQIGPESSPALRQVVIHDNPTNVRIDPGNSSTKSWGPWFYRCWIYNRNIAPNRGIVVNNLPEVPYPRYKTTQFIESVIGPGHSVGCSNYRRNTGITFWDCLLLNPQEANLKAMAPLPSGGFHLLNCTSFLTPLNSAGRGHTCLSPTDAPIDCKNSIFYGGSVDITPLFFKPATNTCQFKTSGNTVWLSPNQLDPKFSGDVGSIPSTVTNAQLSDPGGTYYNTADFALRPDSPIMNKNCGSKITSIKQLLGEDKF
jgi:hypothetical protein